MRDIAAAYDPKSHEAPIVIGHPKQDTPAYGWIEKIIAKEDGLHAVPRQVNPEFAEIVKQGSYKKVSAAFYPPDAPSNPKPGTAYLRHIGFLGAAPPSVKGLKEIQFSEDAMIFFAEEEAFALREHSLAVREASFRRRELEGAIRRANKEGRLPIGLLGGALAFAEALNGGSMDFEFSEDGETVKANRADWFLGFVSKLPVPVVTGEIAGSADFAEQAAAAYPVPKGYSVGNGNRAAMDVAAQNYQREHGGTYAQAVAAVRGNFE
ncbi:hypothetical protein ELI03_34660 [Rhizobium leguminosarum]|uniref:Uncharacterized protein n=1 Tax=Rhizobium leguminosarum TaxID=384 RepID=A0A4Q8XNP4_RHILE|nr:hypothetical protein ELI03_34660 [Rhizobium leguminosarum]